MADVSWYRHPESDYAHCIWLYTTQPSGASTPDEIPVNSMTAVYELSDAELVDALMNKNDDLMRRLARQ